jgi:hypothetical protein
VSVEFCEHFTQCNVQMILFTLMKKNVVLKYFYEHQTCIHTFKLDTKNLVEIKPGANPKTFKFTAMYNVCAVVG